MCGLDVWAVQSVGEPAAVHNRVEADITIVCGRVTEHNPRHHLLVGRSDWVIEFNCLKNHTA